MNAAADPSETVATAADMYGPERHQKKGFVIVRTCCCGCTLGQGTVGAGIWAALESMFVVFGGSLFLRRGTDADQNRNQTDRYGNITQIYTQEDINRLRITGLIYIVQGTALLVASVTLLVGVKMRSRSHLVPWLIVRGIQITVNAVCIVLLFIRGHRLSALAASIVWTVIMIYLYVVVFSYHQADMNRMWSNEEIMIPASQTVFIPSEELIMYSNGPYHSNIPPLGPNDYTSHMPPPFYSDHHGLPVSRPPSYSQRPHAYAQPQEQYNACDQPPPYSAISEEHGRSQGDPKRF